MGLCEHISRKFHLSFRVNSGHLRLAESVCREDIGQTGRSLSHNMKTVWQEFGGERKDWLGRGKLEAWMAGRYVLGDCGCGSRWKRPKAEEIQSVKEGPAISEEGEADNPHSLGLSRSLRGTAIKGGNRLLRPSVASWCLGAWGGLMKPIWMCLFYLPVKG